MRVTSKVSIMASVRVRVMVRIVLRLGIGLGLGLPLKLQLELTSHFAYQTQVLQKQQVSVCDTNLL